jgi:predicted dehydrogenase
MRLKKKPQPKYKAVIVGAGRIASGFDTPFSLLVLTHAHALFNHPRTELAGITDLDRKKGQKEARKWKTKFYPNVKVMLRDTQPDIVVIATPDETHADMILGALSARPKLIICEKPVVTKREDIERLRKIDGGDATILVNFSRRFDPLVERISRELKNGSYGEVLSARGVYTKGIFHNGSHMIDLARLFFGELKKARMSFCVNDCPDGEDTLGGVATFTGCPQFYLMNGDARSYALFEFEIFAEKTHLRFADEGFTLIEQKVIRDPVHEGYRILGQPKQRKSQLALALPNLIAHAVDVLDGRKKPLSSLEEGLKTQEACFQLLDSFKKLS